LGPNKHDPISTDQARNGRAPRLYCTWPGHGTATYGARSKRL